MLCLFACLFFVVESSRLQQSGLVKIEIVVSHEENAYENIFQEAMRFIKDVIKGAFFFPKPISRVNKQEGH